MKKESIGIFGGTFSPPHLGHVYAAKAFLEKERPDRLLIIPTYLPPHKRPDGEATPEQRLEMCRLAFSFDDRIQVSDMEIRRGGKSYTVDTLRELAREDRRLLFLCGTDMLLTLDEWRDPAGILALAEIIYLRRETHAELDNKIRQKIRQYQQEFHAVIRELVVPPYPLSSTEYRSSLQTGGNGSTYLPADVEAYIEKWQLYKN